MKELTNENPYDSGYESSYFHYYGGYGTLVDSFEVETVLDKHDNDYQGDSYYLLRNGDEYGILIFGWGSCSGCDALEGAESMEDVTDLRDSLWNAITWRSFEDTATYVGHKDWEGEFYYYSDGGKEFIAAVRGYFGVA
jgi:hypothetical protein